jgi:pimeloyl-ACP methyl ester carboxylesterase
MSKQEANRPAEPAWFRAALANAPERTMVTVAGAEIEALAWGPRGAPGVLLLHGQGAHADWWSFIAPLLAESWRVAALSWSGMGRSGWRAAYDFDIYAAEAFEVARACGLFEAARPPVFVGHSFGGVPLIYAASRRGRELAGAVVIDCYIRPDNQPGSPRAPRQERPHRRYETFEAAIQRFRLSPPQSCGNDFIIDHIARHSVVQGDDGAWTWRFDPGVRSKLRKVAIAPHLRAVACPLAFIAGARSNLITPSVKHHLLGLAPQGVPWISIPDADHHVMLDQPLALAAALSGLLAVWPDHSGVAG